MAMERLMAIPNAKLPVEGVQGFGLTAYAGLDNGVPTGRCVAGPPAWTPETEYFMGSCIAARKVDGGVEAVFSGTFGPSAVSEREAATLTVRKNAAGVSLFGAFNHNQGAGQ